MLFDLWQIEVERMKYKTMIVYKDQRGSSVRALSLMAQPGKRCTSA